MENGILQYNIAEVCRCKSRAAHKDVKVLEIEDVRKLLDYADENESLMWRVWIRFALITGCRRGEIAGMTWNDIDLDAGVARVSKSVTFMNGKPIINDPKTRSGFRFVGLDDKLIGMMKAYREFAIDDGYIFKSSKALDEPIRSDSVTEHIGKMAKALSMEFSPQVFRRTTFTTLRNIECPMDRIKDYAGHGTGVTKDHYLAEDKVKVREMARSLADAYSGKAVKIAYYTSDSIEGLRVSN